MTSSTNEALVRRAIDAIWNRGDLDVADDVFAPQYVNHYGLIPDLVSGPEAMKISASFYRLAFPNLSVAVDMVSANEDTVVVGWTATSRSDGRSDASLKGRTRTRFVGGKIVESWTEWDHNRCT